ncbi:MAG: YfhO family protein, partial [Actinomycetota bacterium]
TSDGWTPHLVVLEGDPGPGGAPTQPRPGTVDVTSSSDARLAMTVDAGSPSVVLVRTAYDPGWVATVDGEPVDVFPADVFLMGIPVAGGRHAITLTYRDRDIVLGLLLGGIVWLGLLAAFVGALVKERRQAPAPSPGPDVAGRRPSPGRTATRRGAAGSGTPS